MQNIKILSELSICSAKTMIKLRQAITIVALQKVIYSNLFFEAEDLAPN